MTRPNGADVTAANREPASEPADLDFVVRYLDGSDPHWLASRSQWLGEQVDPKQNDAAKFRNMDNFHLWFRAIDQYAPWVRRIHLVTVGHLPEWLNLAHPKLNVVRHDEFIPAEYLPTFNSRTIDMHLDRIPGITERFVVFDDDMFLAAPVAPEDFFLGNLPRLQFVHAPIIPVSNFESTRFFSMVAVNQRVGWGKARLPLAGFSLENGPIAVLRTVLSLPYFFQRRMFIGFGTDHLPIPLRRAYYEAARKEIPERMALASEHKFRALGTINIWHFIDYARARGQFAPRNSRKFGRYLRIGPTSKLAEVLNSGVKVVCINDTGTTSAFEADLAAVNSALEQAFPMPCPYELPSSGSESSRGGGD